MSDARRLFIGATLALAAGLSFSTGGLFVRALPIDPWEILTFRSLFAGLSILAYLAIRDRKRTFQTIRSTGWPGLAIGVMTGWAIIAYIIALQTTLVANVLALMATSTMLVALLAGPVLGERVAPRTWLAVVAGLIGIGFMVSEAIGSGQLIGNILGFTVAVSIAGQTMIARRYRNVDMAPAVLIAAIIAGLVSLPIALPIEATGRDILVMAGFGTIQMSFALVMYFTAARYLPAPTLMLVVLIDAVLGPIWVWLGYDEIPPLFTFIGAAVILGGVAVNSGLAIRELKQQKL